MTPSDEIPVTFDCHGDELVGMIHLPPQPRRRGLMTLVAGGPQYRAGVARIQLQLARELAARGVAVMRFDQRGMGDSCGRLRGFEDMADDIESALAEFRRVAPAVEEVVLWGGCDGAAAALINAWRFPAVTGLVLGNPWVHTEASADAVTIKHHYTKRLRDSDFWLKLLRLQYNPLPALGVVLRSMARRLAGSREAAPALQAEEAFNRDVEKPFVPRMRIGLSRFRGDLLLLMSGRSVVSKEFDELVASRPAWQAALRSARKLVRHEMPDADQTYSSVASRREVIEVTCKWMLDELRATPGAGHSA